MPVSDLGEARKFYGGILGCTEGRVSDRWIDFNLFDHQFVVHLVEGYQGAAAGTSPVDGHNVPVPHFGVIFKLEEWKELAARLRGQVEFVIEPNIRYKGKPGEHGTMFFLDPSGNAVEMKGFANDAGIFDPEY